MKVDSFTDRARAYRPGAILRWLRHEPEGRRRLVFLLVVSTLVVLAWLLFDAPTQSVFMLPALWLLDVVVSFHWWRKDTATP